jgi:ubiquinone/menaquinone biosynthesis C-methylase UbiE
VTSTAGDPGRAFARIDHSGLAPELMAYLDRVAALPEVRALRAMAVDMMALSPGMRVLEAGAGLGEVARELAALVRPGGEVTAVDVSAQMIEAAQARDGGMGITYEIADLTDLPFAANSFDRARCERVLQHLPDPDLALSELTRVTAPDGLVCVLDSDWRSLAVDIDDPGLVDAVMAAFYAMAPQADIGRTLRRRFARAGLVDVEVKVQPFTYESVAAAAGIFPFFDESVPPEAKLVPGDLRDRWFAALRRADAEGTFWVAALGYVVCGTVPEAAA